MTILNELRILLERLYSLSSRSMIDVDVRTIHDQIMSILDSSLSDTEIQKILSSNGASSLRRNLIKINEELHMNTEIDLARKFLHSASKGDDPFLGSWINKGFHEMLEGQVARWRMLGFFSDPSNEPIVVVGGGALPQTQVFIHRVLGCDVISVERNPEAAQLCQSILNRIGLNKLSVITSDGDTYDFEGAYLVVVATLVRNKSSIAHRIAETSPKTIFAPRTPTRLHQMWRETLQDEELESIGWQQLDYWCPSGSSVATTVYVHS